MQDICGSLGEERGAIYNQKNWIQPEALEDASNTTTSKGICQQITV